MKKMITILILLSFVVTGPAYASLSWTCPNCGQTFYFDNRDSEYMNNWIPIHEAACRGGSSSSSSSSSYSYTPHGRPTLAGAFLLGGLCGGILGGVYGLAYAQPELLTYAAAGAFIGCVFTGLLWIVSEE